MVIEDDDCLVFESGKRIYVGSGVVGLNAEGDLTEGYSDQLLTHELNDQEKWELARFMVNRWMDFRDKLWEAHEKTLSSLGHLLDQNDVRERGEAETEKLHDTLLGGPESRPTLTDMLEEAELPVWDGVGTLKCRCQVVPVGEIVEVPKCQDTACFEQSDDYKDGCSLTDIERDRCRIWKDLIALKKELNTGGYLVRGDTAAAIKEELKKEELYYSDAEAQMLLNNFVYCPECECLTNVGLAKESPNCWRIVEPRYCMACGWKDKELKKEAAEDYTCPVPDCFYVLEGKCTYMNPRDCGIKLNYINSIEVELNLKKKEVNYLHADIDHLKVGTKTGWGQEA